MLSRKLNESVIIGEGLIEIKVVGIKGERVRLGFDAPPDIRIDRAELHTSDPLNTSGMERSIALDHAEFVSLCKEVDEWYIHTTHKSFGPFAKRVDVINAWALELRKRA